MALPIAPLLIIGTVGLALKVAGSGVGDAGEGVEKAGDSLTKLIFVGGSFYVLYKVIRSKYD